MITLFIIIYITSVILTWKYMSIAHSKNGIFKSLDISIVDLLITITPVLNTTFTLIGWSFYYPEKRDCYDKQCRWDIRFFNKLFNIKK